MADEPAVLDAPLALDLYPLDETVLVPVAELKLNEWNPRSITPEAKASLKESMRSDPQGLWDRPCIALPDDGVVIAGNHRLLAALEMTNDETLEEEERLKWSRLPTRFRDVDDAQARVIALRDNNGWAQYDDYAVSELLREMSEPDRALTGFPDEHLLELLALAAPLGDPGPHEGGDGADGRGNALALSDVSVGDPVHVVAKGETWKVGHHLLVCAGIYDGWKLWAQHLEGDVLFVPYPTPTLPLTERAANTPLVMVQPDVWLAGHVLDKYAAVHGDDSVERV